MTRYVSNGDFQPLHTHKKYNLWACSKNINDPMVCMLFYKWYDLFEQEIVNKKIR
jgi:hypothetical protein